ncbi:MAG: PQQ-dependent sugar dehydrogenase [Bacteroidetes bacterium]|nr:PQQ-dependent sugar dehydrogenase [Bacteroidota bacterium]
MNKPPKFFAIITILLCKLSFAQPANDNCANAFVLSTGSTCVAGTSSLTGQTLSGATVEGAGFATSCGGATTSQDVWYKFVAVNLKPTIAISNKGTSWGTVMRVQLLSGSCGSFTELDCKNNPTSFTPTNNLTLGNTYYIRILKNNTTAPTGLNWGFDICLTGTVVQQSRMNEIFKQTLLDNAINKAWEVTYGPDDYLWVTGSQDYKAYRIDPNTGAKTTILDISRGSSTSELTVGEHTAFNATFSSFSGGITTNGTTNELAPTSWGTNVKVPWPQGGFAGLAIHPEFNSGKPYVYISYVRKYDSTSATNKGGYYFTNSLVRFTYNTGTNKLESPVSICDTLPGSNDHNSQRIIIAPVGGTYYLFYAQGDMGAGQLNTLWRPNRAQDTTYYQGKILRFNLEADADAGTYDKWIPNDNPYNHASQSAVWATGIRNNQGFAYNPATDVLYGSSHGPYTDDEINIIQRYKNYGHPLIEGFSGDGNYNGNSTPGTSTSYTAGETFATNSGISSLAPIGDEQHNADSINASGFAPYKDPLFSAYASAPSTYTPANCRTVASIWGAATKPGNGGWPSEGWSGLDVYTNSIIPGWKNSLLAAGLKWGRVLRLKLNTAGTSIVQSDGADTVALWQGPNGYRDIAFAPNGKDIFVSVDRTSASGPGGTAPPASVTACAQCLIKYTFLGYTAGANNRSTIPTTLAIGNGIPGIFQTANKVVINAANGNNSIWVPITDTNSNVVAEINANGNDLDTVTTTLFTRTGTGRMAGGKRYVNRNLTITPQHQPATAVWIRLYISQAEFNQYIADGESGDITLLKIIKNSDSAKTAIVSSTIAANTTIAESFNSGQSYVLQGTINSFSSFYFSSGPITILPVTLLSFTGDFENNAALLRWTTEKEVNTSQFVIERGTNGRDFVSIGTVAAKGNSSSSINYTYSDNDIMKQSSSIVYYRLKMMDKDNAFKYSDVVKITLPFTSGRVNLFPNPATEEVNVAVDAPFDGKAQWKLMDNTGRIILQSKESLKKGNNNFAISISKLSTGIYYFVISGAGIDQQIKLQKL